MSIAVTTETQEVKLHPLAATTDPVLAEHADEIRRLGKQTVENIIEIGARLTECKHICGHGNWLPWLEREFGWEETTAQRFMRVHALAQSKSGNLPDLPVSAIYLLAAPSTPEAARSEIIERAKTGTPVSVAEVKAIIDTAKGSRRLAKKKAKTGKSKVASEREPAKIAKAAAEAPQVSLDKNPVGLAWKTATEVERAELRTCLATMSVAMPTIPTTSRALPKRIPMRMTLRRRVSSRLSGSAERNSRPPRTRRP
jgi:hypothetical protein